MPFPIRESHIKTIPVVTVLAAEPKSHVQLAPNAQREGGFPRYVRPGRRQWFPNALTRPCPQARNSILDRCAHAWMLSALFLRNVRVSGRDHVGSIFTSCFDDIASGRLLTEARPWDGSHRCSSSSPNRGSSYQLASEKGWHGEGPSPQTCTSGKRRWLLQELAVTKEPGRSVEKSTHFRPGAKLVVSGPTDNGSKQWHHGANAG